MSLKKIFAILMVVMIFAIMPLEVQAVNENFRIVKSNEDYIIYIAGFEDTEFAFAFNNNAEVNPEELNYINNWTDSNGVNVACLDDGFGLDLTQKVYLWVKDLSNNEVLSKAELDLNEVLDLAKLSELNTLTKRIDVDTTQKDNVEEVSGGVKITKELGKIIIKDTQDGIFKYDIYKLSKNNDAAKLVDLLEKTENLSDKEMIEKIDLLKETEQAFEALIANANWKDVSENEIKQPEDSVDGDRYLVLLQETGLIEQLNTDSNNVTIDLQILECNYKEKHTIASEKVPLRTASILPVTGEEIGLYVFFAVVIVLIAIVVIRIFFLSRKNKNEDK